MTTGRQQHGPDTRPVLAVLVHELTPYRVHFHRRIAREIPEFRLCTVLLADSAGSPWGALEAPGFEIVPLAEGRPAPSSRRARHKQAWRISERVHRFLGTQRVGAVLCVGYFDLPLIRAVFWAGRRGIPCMLFGDGNIRSDRASGLKKSVKRIMLSRLLRRYHRILPCGTLGEQFYRWYGAGDEQIIRVPYEPDYERIASIPDHAIGGVRERLGLDPTRRRMLVCGRLVPAKRPDLALRAFLAIADRRPEWDLVLAGAGPMLESLKAQIPGPLAHRVIFTGFIADQDQLTALYHAVDILVHAAQHEPWGLIINEAVAAGLPIVSTDVVGASVDLVQHGENGLLVPCNDRGALAAAILEITEPERLAAARAKAPAALARWRAQADPIAGLRRALGLPPVPGDIADPRPRAAPGAYTASTAP